MNILVAEDEKDVRNLLKISLTQEGFNVFCAKDGIEALDLIKKNKIDLGILDVMMPRLDGFNLLKKVRESSTFPVIFLTARGEEYDKVIGLGLGADDYLVKPFSMVELIARVNAQLRRATEYMNQNQSKSKTITFGELTLDLNAYSVCKNGKLLDLNTKEYLLLAHFMKHPNRVFTKKQLYREVWDDDYYFDDNTVMVHISHIRNKIERDAKNPSYIKTIRGIGYKFEYQEYIS